MRTCGYRCELGARVLVLFLFLAPATTSAKSVGYERSFIDGVVYHVVRVNLKDPSVKVSPLLTARYPGGGESGWTMIRRYWPAAAVTGTEFCTVSLRPIGDLVIDGTLRHFGGMGKALALTPDNQAAFISVPYARRLDWAGFESVLAAGPTLVHQGKVSVNARAEGFTDPHILGEAARTAVGLTASRKLLFVATSKAISLGKLAKALVRLGCVEAINLDGGSSTALYYRGEWPLSPGRPLVNLLAVFEDVPRTRRRAAEPTGSRPSAMARWRSEQAWELALHAAKLPPGDRKLDLLTRACELDASNASYCSDLGALLLQIGDRDAAASAYARASERLRAKQMAAEAFATAQRAVDLAPQEPHVVMELGRAARVVGRGDLAREAMQRARALFLVASLPESRPASLTQVVEALRKQAAGPEPPRYSLASTVTGRTLSAESLGLYVHVPEEWDWLPMARASAAVAQRRYMPWLVHFAVAGVPEGASLELVRQEYLRNTMLITEAARPTMLGRAVALRFTAHAMSGDEPARYDIILAKQRTLLLIVTMAAQDRWWAQAEEEFKDVLSGVAFVHPETP